jgi:hypothetical protein
MRDLTAPTANDLSRKRGGGGLPSTKRIINCLVENVNSGQRPKVASESAYDLRATLSAPSSWRGLDLRSSLRRHRFSCPNDRRRTAPPCLNDLEVSRASRCGRTLRDTRTSRSSALRGPFDFGAISDGSNRQQRHGGRLVSH